MAQHLVDCTTVNRFHPASGYESASWEVVSVFDFVVRVWVVDLVGSRYVFHNYQVSSWAKGSFVVKVFKEGDDDRLLAQPVCP